MLRRVLVVLATAALAFLLLPVAPAAAHGQLVESSPVNDGTISAPVDAVALYFTEKPASNAYFTVTGPDGGRLDHGWYHGEPKRLDKPVQELFLVDGKWEPRLYNTGFPVRITVAHWPAAGRYVATYVSVASDGEPVRGEVSFTYTGPTTPAPSDWQPPTNSADPTLLAALGTATPAAPASGSTAEDSDGVSIWVWLVPAVLVVGAGVLIARAGRRSAPATAASKRPPTGTRSARRKAAQQRHAATRNRPK